MKNQDLSSVYNQKFYKTMMKYELKSAAAFAETVLRSMRPGSLIDVGCGNGIYLKAFYDKGIKDLIGVDGSIHAVEMSLLPGKVKLHDLRAPLKLPRKYDLCLCMEVAEHLPPEYAGNLVNTLTGLSNRVLFTAALPGQGGNDHINEQPHEYWIKLFRKKGF